MTIGSTSGTTVNFMQYVDARGNAAVGAGIGILAAGVTKPAGGSYPLAIPASYDGQVIQVDTTAARTLTLPTPVAGFKVSIVDISGQAGANKITLNPFSTDKIMGLNVAYILEANWGYWTFFSDGTDWFIVD